MATQCFVLLVISVFLSKCLGHTEFIYTTKDEVNLFCDTNKWQINPESNNIITVNCTVECVNEKPLNLNNIQKFCTNKVGENCSLITNSGFYRCVTALDSGFLFPFKPSPNTVTSYIVASPNEDMTTESEERSSVELTEGEDLLLNCSFIFTGEYENLKYTVYWIKTIEKNSNCVYSYDIEFYDITYNHHCNLQKDLLYRLSNQTVDKNTHNIRIRNVTESDAGQYLCALHDHTRGKWKIINNLTVCINNHNNITVCVYNQEELKPDEQPDEKTQVKKGIDLIPLYATISVILVLAVVAFIWKKKTSAGSQAIELQTNQNRNDTEETADMDCSLYAIGYGEEEIKIGSGQDVLCPEGQEEDFYSVMKTNDLYDLAK